MLDKIDTAERHDAADRTTTEDENERRVIEIFVNEKPVHLKGRLQTGASIKAAAIAQRVDIKPDFVLSLELGGGQTQLIGDKESIKVRPGMRFLAIPNDDNS